MNKIINPNEKYPVKLPDGSAWSHTIFLKNFIHHLNIQIGDHTYFNNFRLPVDNLDEKRFFSCRRAVGHFSGIALEAALNH